MRAEQASMLQDSTSLAEAATGHPLRRSEVSKYWSGKATSYIAAHPKAWARLLWLKVLNFWNAFEYDDLSVIQKLRESGIIMPGLHFGVAAALAVPGIVLALRAFSTSGWVLAGILAQMISVLPVFVTERYRLAAVPGLLVFAAFGLWRLWQSLSVGRIRTAALYFAALVASTAFVSIPQTDPALWALISYASGRQALDSNDFARAERELQRARAYVPENPETNLALGNLRLAQGKRTQAASFYAESLRFNPKHKGALNNLGLIALEEGRPRDAARNLQRAIESDPHDATTFYLLAKAELALGNIENARIAIGEALKREPDQPEYQRLGGEIEQHRHN
jgi:Flp pilus assembly protein TadD